MPGEPALTPSSVRILYAIALQRICSPAAPICARSRSCSVTPAFAPPSTIPMWIAIDSGRSTGAFIHEGSRWAAPDLLEEHAIVVEIEGLLTDRAGGREVRP